MKKNQDEGFFKKIQNSVITRAFLIGFIILIMLIPFNMILNLIRERENRKRDVINEISSKWAYDQTLTGPVLEIPYIIHQSTDYIDEFGKKRARIDELINEAHFLPDKLIIKGRIFPEIRSRGIYNAVVYTSDLEISGEFSFPDLGKLNIPLKDALLNDASIIFGITDMRGINKNIDLKWNSINTAVNPGLNTKHILNQGVNSKVILKNDKTGNSFEIKLNIKGSNTISFLPIGKETLLRLESDWASPSFNGLFLPKNRIINEKGFTADWQIFDYNREFPQAWANDQWKIEASKFGVELFTSVDEYQKATRSAKYAILIIFLTFLACFVIIELINKKRVHPIQYILVGFSLCMFYLLLISLSEHIKFNPAYMISSVITIAVIIAYTKYILGKNIFAVFMTLLLSSLYAFIFIILQLEDYSLVAGALGLFVILSVIMIATRKINWYNFKLDRKD